MPAMRDATEKEAEIALKRLLASGRSVESIADELSVCSRTIANWRGGKIRPRRRDRNALKAMAEKARGEK